MSPVFIGALVLLGACTGFAAGLLGIGGGMLMVPFLTLLFTWQGFPTEHIVHMAIATSLATILFTSVSSVRAHDQRGAVLWRVVWLLAPGILVGSLIGAQIAGRLPTFWLSVIFAIFVSVSAMQMLRDRKPRSTRELPRGAGMFAAGGAIGFVSSLVGAGGGFISVPFMVWSNVSIHNAVAHLGRARLPDRRSRNHRIHPGRPCRTGSAGRHAWFRLPAGAVRDRPGKRADGAARSTHRAHARSPPAAAHLRGAAVPAGGLHGLPGLQGLQGLLKRAAVPRAPPRFPLRAAGRIMGANNTAERQ